MNLKKYLYSPFFYIVLIVVGYFGFTKLGDTDFGFHLAQGRYFFENNYHLPIKEVFSFSIANQTNIILSWFFDVVVYFIYLKLGVWGLSLWKSALLVLLATLFILRLEKLASAIRLNINKWFVYSAVFLFIASIYPWADIERPHALGYVYFSIFLLLINFFLEKPKLWQWVALIGLQLLWANSHTSFTAPLIITAILIFGSLVELYFRDKRKKKGDDGDDTGVVITRKIKDLGLLLVLLILVSLVNPYGIDLFINFIKASPSSAYVFIEELKPAKLGDFYNALGFFWLVSLMPLWRFWREKNYKMIFVFGAFAFLGIRSVRFIYDYAILTAPFSMIEIFRYFSFFNDETFKKYNLSPTFQEYSAVRHGKVGDPLKFWEIRDWNFWLKNIAGISAVVVCLLIFVFSDKTKEHGFGFSVSGLPAKTADFILENNIKGKMFNSFGLGSYLIWRLYPHNQVFVDSRAQNYIEEGEDKTSLLLDNYKIFSGDEGIWRKLDDKYKFDFAIVEWPFIKGQGFYNLNDKILNNQEWAPVFLDANAIVYLRRIEANKTLIEQYEYKYIKPQKMDSSYFKDYFKNETDKQMLLGELNRSLKENPTNYRIHFFYAVFLALQKDSNRNELISHLKTMFDLNPKFILPKELLKSFFKVDYGELSL